MKGADRRETLAGGYRSLRDRLLTSPKPLAKPTNQPKDSRAVDAFARWLRSNSEHYLLEAVQTDLARSYLGREGPVGARGPMPFFWRHVFVPVYRRLPWLLRQRLMQSMPGSHRRTWSR